jgi:tRNA pseudouridine13 synthase
LEQIRSQGIPNYFGLQRFGRDAGNLRYADQLLNRTIRVRDRQKQSIYLSAARSYLFNLALAARVEDGSWCQRKDGGGSQIGSLYGKGEFDSPYEKAVEAQFPDWCEALVGMGMKRSYRPLMVEPTRMTWSFADQERLILEFELPRGCFATTLLEELIDMQDSTMQDQIDE